MASQSYIIEQEKEIVQHTSAIHSIADAFIQEGENEGTGKPYPENRDLWGTLYANLVAQQRRLALTIGHFEREFGPGGRPINEKERIEEAVRAFTSLCNIMGHDTEAFVKLMGMDHRTLQQAFTGLTLKWLKYVASPEYETDLRNEYSKKIAQKVMSGIEEWELNVPTI